MTYHRIEMDDDAYAALCEQLKDVPDGYTPIGFAKAAIVQAKSVGEEHPCRTDPSAPCCGSGCSS